MQNQKMNRTGISFILFFSLLAPYFFYPILLSQISFMALFAMSLNLLFGYGGLLSFGHAAFFGLSSYLTGYMLKEYSLSPLFAIFVSLFFIFVLSVFFGFLAVRRKGIYFSMITLALSQLVYFLIVSAPFSNNEDGYQGVPRGELFGFINLSNDYFLYYFVFGIVFLTWVAIYRIVNSPYGNVLKAIRNNEQRVRSLGYNVENCKLLIFSLSAAVAAIAGSLKVITFGMASLSDVHWHQSTDGVIMMILGGAGYMISPVLGAFIMVFITYLLAGSFDSLVPVIMGSIFIVCVLAFRGGFMEFFIKLINFFNRKLNER